MDSSVAENWIPESAGLGRNDPGSGPESGGFVARWDDPPGGGITTRGDTLGDLPAMVADAVAAYFEPGEVPARVTVHFAEDPVFQVASSPSR